ncbi:hypothetical protein [Phenylobacterium sp.]|uniref:hypothetical protein n=1 Tax=Phenylobacterium sp. TaxID=1871053 RepID=UPI002736446B|nr:hypothetical protein [Phenylobacterium sp.]MDP3852335.1 hypothetical protein [Phenylobacterium sp.]
MPHSVLRVVAVIIGICAVGGFALGVRNVPDKARLPGESAGGSSSALQAADATPVGELLVTDPPPPPPEEKTEEEAAEKTEEVRAAEMAKLEAEAKAVAAARAVAAPKAAPPEDKVGDLIETLPPPPEQPPY